MQQYIERMIQEQKELKGRISRLQKAVENPPYGIDKKGLELLEEQLEPMKLYSDILQKRIEYEGAK